MQWTTKQKWASSLLACGLGLTVGCSSSDDAASTATEPPQVARLKEALEERVPAAQVLETDGVVRAFGTELAAGRTPDEAVASFIVTQAKALGAAPGELVARDAGGSARGPGAGGRAAGGGQPLGLMYDRQRGTYKFFLYRHEQVRGGLPVLDGTLLTLVRNDGSNAVVWSSSTVKNLGNFAAQNNVQPPQVDSRKTLSALSAMTDFTGRPLPSTLAITQLGAPETAIFAGRGKNTVSPRLASTYTVDTANPLGKWRVVADAATGDVLDVENLVSYEDITGNVSGNVTAGVAAMDCADEAPVALADAEVSLAGGGSTFTDATGAFVLPYSGTSPVDVSSPIGGLYFDVVDYGGNNELLSATATPPGPVSFLHNPANSTDALRAQANGYANAMGVRDFLLAYVPDYPVIATQTNFLVSVNRTDGYCPGNAWYDGSSINFCVSGSGYANTSFASVSHHEFGHHIVQSGGSGQGAYGEGMSDVVASLLAQDPGLAYGFFLNDCTTPLRTADNDCQYSASACSSCGSEVHACGNLISGAIWSVRELLAVSEPNDYVDILNSLVLSSIPMHTGTGINLSIAIDLLTLDDDDGNLDNGTPHRSEICGGFAAHGMPCPVLPTGLSVTPSGGQVESEGPLGGPFVPEAFTYTLTNLGPEASLDYAVSVLDAPSWLQVVGGSGQIALGETAQVTLSIDQAAAALLPNGDQFATVQFSNLSNGIGDTSSTVRLRVGIPQAIYSEDFENGLGDFTLSAGSNNLWRVASDCASTQTGHSTPSSLYFGTTSCNFETGATVVGTATSPTFSIANTQLALLRLNYFLANEGGSTYDRASVEISVDGGPFTVVASSYGSGATLIANQGNWHALETDITSLVAGLQAPSVQLRFAFDSRDAAYNNYAGFLVDDVQVRAYASGCVTDADCDDNLSCSGTETCVAGSCVPGTPVSCDDNLACTIDSCDEATSCVNEPSDAACSDGSLCNGIELCDPFAGCLPGTPLNCDDGDLCTADSCDPALGCTTTPVSCDDGDACTADSCDPITGCGSTPVSCDDSNACTVDSCDPLLGCGSTPVSCDDGDACTVDACDPVLGCSSTPLSCDDGDPCTDDSCGGGTCSHVDNGSCGVGPFQESGGQVVMEAENFHTYVPRASHTWDVVANTGASNGQVLRANPNNGTNLNTSYVTGSPELRYDVNFTTAGTYTVWVRGIGPSADDDSCHVGIDGTGPGSADRISSFSTSLSWSKSTMDGNSATISVPSPGVHTISLWMREDGFSFDKLLLTTNSSYTPSGNGPAESSQGGGGPECSSDAGCDDGNSCTSDTCTGGACSHAAVSNGTACGDDGNVCTDDVCQAGSCGHPANTASCTDDGNSCTSDVCSAGSCTHPDNGTCQSTGPCAAYCANPTSFSGNYNSGNLGTQATCHETTGTINGGVCGNLSGGRTLSVNGQQMSCTGGNWGTLPPKENGGYCVTTTAGNFAWAYFVTW